MEYSGRSHLVEDSPASVLTPVLEPPISSPLPSGRLLLHVDLLAADLRLARSVGLWLDVHHVLLAHGPNLITDARTTPAPCWLHLADDSALWTLLIHDLATKGRGIRFQVTVRNMHVSGLLVASASWNLDDGGGSIVHDLGPSSHQIHGRWKHGHSLTTADDPGAVADSLEDDRLLRRASATATNRDHHISNHLLLLLGLGDGLLKSGRKLVNDDALPKTLSHLHQLADQLLRGCIHSGSTFLCLRRSGLKETLSMEPYNCVPSPLYLQAAGLGDVPWAGGLSLGNSLQRLSLDPPCHALLGSRAFASPLVASNPLPLLLPLVSFNNVI